jgi:hypothetical protein
VLIHNFLFSGDHFPLEARHHLAPWLEQNFTTELDLANPQHEEHAQRLVLELVAQLESKEICSKLSKSHKCY